MVEGGAPPLMLRGITMRPAPPLNMSEWILALFCDCDLCSAANDRRGADRGCVMLDDQEIAVAAGLIVWHLEREPDVEKAVEAVKSRMPHLTPGDIANALSWAQAARRFAASFAARDGRLTVKDIQTKGINGGQTVQQMLDQSGLARFING